jgi:hypothetical protein
MSLPLRSPFGRPPIADRRSIPVRARLDPQRVGETVELVAGTAE